MEERFSKLLQILPKRPCILYLEFQTAFNKVPQQVSWVNVSRHEIRGQVLSWIGNWKAGARSRKGNWTKTWRSDVLMATRHDASGSSGSCVWKPQDVAYLSCLWISQRQTGLMDIWPESVWTFLMWSSTRVYRYFSCTKCTTAAWKAANLVPMFAR